MKIAFFKSSKGTLQDKIISIWTFGPYSHVELIFYDKIGYSSTASNGCVRYKNIDFYDGCWDIFEIPIKEEDIKIHCDKYLGLPYDWLGIFLTQIIPIGIQDRKKKFCSEVVIEVLKKVNFMPNLSPSAENPNSFARKLKKVRF